MRKEADLVRILTRERRKANQQADSLIEQARQLLIADQFSEKHILKNLKSYNESFELVNEEECLPDSVFRIEEIKKICTRYRLRFLDSQLYQCEIPDEAVFKIRELNKIQHKDIRHFKVLATADDFSDAPKYNNALLFAKTLYGNYHLIHDWGKPLMESRKIKYYPFRNLECLFICILVFTLCLTLSIPTRRLTTDLKADYFSMYRIAAFFHLLILIGGFCIYLTVAFRMKFSAGNWDELHRKK